MNGFGKRERSFVLAFFGVLGAGSCLVTAPLEDPPEVDARNTTGGTGGTAGTSDGGEAGAGDSGNVGGSSGTGTGGSAGTGGTDPNACTTNAECVELGAGEPYRCRPSDHRCVALKTNECPLAYGDAADPNALYVGAFATLGVDRPDVNSIVWAHRLALEELSGDNVGGLPGGPNGARRPLVMIVCNNDAEVVEASVRHLAEDVEVPALMATLLPGDLRRAFEAYREREIFFLSPVAATRTLVEYEDDDLVWTMLGQPSDLAPAYNELLGLVESYVGTERPLVGSRDLRVILITTTDAFNDELKNFVEPALRFNGQTAAVNRTNGNYLSLTVDADEPDVVAAAEAVFTFRPDVVISVAGEPFSQSGGIAEIIELDWERFITDLERPYYILSPFNAGNTAPIQNLIEVEAWGALGIDPFAYRRFVGVSVAGADDLTLQNDYASRLLTRFPNAITDTGNYYDATYFLAYAMYGAGNADPLTGPDIALGMRRLLDGPAFGVGPMEISAVFEALDENPGIELEGTLGPPDFDLRSGVKFAVGSVFCFAEAGQMAVLRADVLRYNRDLGNFSDDEFPCFDGFYP